MFERDGLLDEFVGLGNMLKRSVVRTWAIVLQIAEEKFIAETKQGRPAGKKPTGILRAAGAKLPESL